MGGEACVETESRPHARASITRAAENKNWWKRTATKKDEVVYIGHLYRSC